MNENNNFGIEMLLKTEDIKRKTDVLIALAHSVICEDRGYMCIGVGEDSTKSATAAGSHSLPDGWNSGEEHKYELQYAGKYTKYVRGSFIERNILCFLLGHMSDDLFFLTFLNVEGTMVRNMVLDIELLVKKTNGKLVEMMPTAANIKERIISELIGPNDGYQNNNYSFGIEILLKLAKSDIQCKADVVICLAHFTLVKSCEFQCIGVGECKTLSGGETESELLPDGWNNDSSKYALRYINGKTLYILMGKKWNNLVILYLFNVITRKMSSISLNMDDCVKQTNGNFVQMMPSAVNRNEKLWKELIEPVVVKPTVEDVYRPC